MANANNKPGLYVVFDGISGCGKGTQIEILKQNLPLDFPGIEIVFTYEPGGNPEADKLRQRIKHEQMTAEEEMLLLVQSRAITIPEVVIPVLERGGLIISDRGYLSNFAYQGGGRELGIKKVWEANREVVNSTHPDVFVHLNVGIIPSLRRSKADNPDKFDREKMLFWERCVRGYSDAIEFIRQISPNTKIIQINDPNGTLTIEQTWQSIKSQLYPIIRKTLSREGRGNQGKIKIN